MKAIQILPEGYRQVYSVNIQKDKKVAVWVNVLALAIAAVMAVPMHFVVPFSTFSDLSHGYADMAIRLVVFVAGSVVYLVLHEAVHGIAMKCFGTKKIKYGFTGMFAFACSDDYYDKRSYILIALAPVVVFGVIFAVANCFVPLQWFWCVYLWQVCNISGAAGDLFVTVKFSQMPKDILVQDTGVGMTVYSRQA